MPDTFIPSDVHSSWKHLISSEELSSLLEDIYDAATKSGFYPKEDAVMRFMKQDLVNVKCVIVGMDPYASDYENEEGKIVPQATGRSFEVAQVREANDWNFRFKQSSLQNIVKAIHLYATGEKASLDDIRQELSYATFELPAPADLFDSLEEQGVMFLNASLTVAPGEPGSHKKLWDEPMRHIVEYIDDVAHPVWMLWGKDAQDRIISILGDDADRIVKAKHPRLAGFVDENVFSRVPNIKWTCGAYR